MLNLAEKKILVTGGRGFLGTHVVQKLVARGIPASSIAVPDIAECDLRRQEACQRAVEGMQVVLHLAGITGDTEFHRTHPARIFYDNLLMGVYLMEAARRAGVEKFVGIGSATEYPDNAPLPFREENLWSGPVEIFHRPYTVAKKMIGVQAAAYRKQYGMNTVHLILTNMYGPGHEASAFVITNLIRKILSAKRTGANVIEMWGTGQVTRDFLYVEDAAEGVIMAAERYDSSDPVNMGSGWEVSIRELAEAVARLMDFKGEIRWDQSKPDGQPRRMLDITKAEHAFGFRPATLFDEGLRRTIAWHEQHQNRE